MLEVTKYFYLSLWIYFLVLLTCMLKDFEPKPSNKKSCKTQAHKIHKYKMSQNFQEVSHMLAQNWLGKSVASLYVREGKEWRLILAKVSHFPYSVIWKFSRPKTLAQPRHVKLLFWPDFVWAKIMLFKIYGHAGIRFV